MTLDTGLGAEKYSQDWRLGGLPKMFVLGAFLAAVATGAIALGGTSAGTRETPAAACPRGGVIAVIGGKRTCLKAGSRCASKYQKQYRKYGFTCRKKRLSELKLNVRISAGGPEQVVYSWSRDRCEDIDIPDLPARAFRGADGQVQLTIAHYVNRRMVGPGFNHLTHDCTPVLTGGGDPNPAAFNDKEWLASVYTTDGQTIYALGNVEYQGNTHPGQCPSGEYLRCWWNTLVLEVSTDGGRSYHRQGPRNGLVAAIPYRYQPDLGFEGEFTPSQIVRNPNDGYYYTAIAETVLASGAVQGGLCLIRTRDLADPTAWRAPDERGAFTRTFIDPYTQSGGSPAEHVCGKYIKTRPPRDAPFHVSLSWNTYLNRWLLVGMDQFDPKTGAPTWGIYYSVSKDLVTWTTQRLLIQKKTVFDYQCGDPDPIAYPSLIDPASHSRSFGTTARSAYLYYTVLHYSDCQQTLNHDLVRVPVTISK